MENIAIIGIGTMGTYTANALAKQGSQITVHDPNLKKDTIEERLNGIKHTITSSYQEAVKNADLVLFCTPTHQVYTTMKQTLPYCKKYTVIGGQTSRKLPEVKAFDEYRQQNKSSKLEMVTLHTMCNPKNSNAEKEICAIIRHHSSNRTYSKMLELYGSFSNHIEEFKNFEEHDFMTANTQVNTARTLLGIAHTTGEEGTFPWLECEHSDGVDAMKFPLAMRVANAPSHIYAGICLGNDYASNMIKKCNDSEILFFGDIGMQTDSMVPLIYTGRVVEKILEAKRFLFGEEERLPILDKKTVEEFAGSGTPLVNSHYSLIQYGLSLTRIKRNPFDDLKATTPNHTALVCLLDYVFNTEILDEVIEHLTKNSRQACNEDCGYHYTLQKWSESIINNDVDRFNLLHKDMRSLLSEEDLKIGVEKSKAVVGVCRKKMKEFRGK